jgi:hypothetical protein
MKCFKFVSSSLVVLGLSVSPLLAGGAGPHETGEKGDLSFFITSMGSGKGANLGGLGGADEHCTALATKAGSTGKMWAAYLSVVGDGEHSAANAKDRIGTGPWYNAKGVMVAKNVADLHSDNNKLSKENSLDENGNMINGRGDKPNKHDILSGTNLDGTLATGDKNLTCGNWTSEDANGSAMVGHHDRAGGGANPTSWQAAHPSRGCSQANLEATGGHGFFYCFAK